MANSFGNLMAIDTAGVTSTYTTRIWALKIRWVGATTPGHRAVVTDPVNNKILWSGVAPNANYEDEEKIEMNWKNGFTVPTLGSGQLFIQVG